MFNELELKTTSGLWRIETANPFNSIQA